MQPIKFSLLLALSMGTVLAQSPAPTKPPAEDNDVSRMSFPTPDGSKGPSFEDASTSIQSPQTVAPASPNSPGELAQVPPSQTKNLPPPGFRDIKPPAAPPVKTMPAAPVPNRAGASAEANSDSLAEEPGIVLPLVPPNRFRKRFAFNGEPLADVIGEISQEFRTPLVLEADPTQPISGNYVGTDAIAILRLLADDAQVSYEKRDGVIYIMPVKPAQLLVARLDDLATQISAGDAFSVASNPAAAIGNEPKLLRVVMDAKKGLVVDDQVKADPAMDARLRSLSLRRAALLVERRKLANQFP